MNQSLFVLSDVSTAISLVPEKSFSLYSVCETSAEKKKPPSKSGIMHWKNN
jgi:hypothetical protein